MSAFHVASQSSHVSSRPQRRVRLPLLLLSALLLALGTVSCGDDEGGDTNGNGNGNDNGNGDGNGDGNGGDGKKENCTDPADPCVVNTVEELESIGQNGYDGFPENLKGHYILGNDIDADETKDWHDGSGFYPISEAGSPFTGSFDGDGYTIRNLYIDVESHIATDAGLFGVLESDAVIKNVHLEDANIRGAGVNDPVGGIAAINKGGTIENVSVTGEIHGAHTAGGIVGTNQDGLVKKAHNKAKVEADSSAGGIAGTQANGAGQITDAINEGKILAHGSAGGIVANNAAMVTRSHNRGTITGKGGFLSNLGGIAGSNGNDGVIEFSSSDGNIEGISDAVGGLVGQNHGEIRASFSSGNIDVEGSKAAITGGAGGLVGFNLGHIENAYSRGNVTTTAYYDELDDSDIGGELAGGLVGSMDSHATVTNTYSTGSVSSDDVEGGLVGTNADNAHNNITASCWEASADAPVTSAGGEDVDTNAMGNENTFDGWDFNDVWTIQSNYPELRNIPHD